MVPCPGAVSMLILPLCVEGWKAQKPHAGVLSV